MPSESKVSCVDFECSVCNGLSHCQLSSLLPEARLLVISQHLASVCHVISKTSCPGGHPVLSAQSFCLCSTTVCSHPSFWKASLLLVSLEGYGDPARCSPSQSVAGVWGSNCLTSPRSICVSQPHHCALGSALHFLAATYDSKKDSNQFTVFRKYSQME